MSAPACGGTLGGMNISTHSLPGAHPVDTGWVDDALATVYAAGDPLGALVGRPLVSGDGLMLVGWSDGGAGRFELADVLSGHSTGPARYMQVITFDGPRSPEWAAAERLAATRMWPAARDVPGVVRILRLQAEDNGVTVVTLAETADAIDETVRAVLSTSLLPGEDPALLTGPDRIGIYRLVHADLPVEASTDAESEGSRGGAGSGPPATARARGPARQGTVTLPNGHHEHWISTRRSAPHGRRATAVAGG
jgi:hypothetical protein